jgi:potassium-transporting ATPase KdpC subunit
MKTQWIIALKFLLGMTILTGIIYPLIMTGIAQLVFPEKANGSLVIKEGKIVGSTLIGQKFDSAIYFWSRPSAIDYNPIPSSGSNLGPISNKLKKLTEERRKAFAVKNSIKDTLSVPKEMIFASASGLDPHISPEAALMQVERVVSTRNYNEAQKQKVLGLIKSIKKGPQFSLLGEPRINVFELNLALDNIR